MERIPDHPAIRRAEKTGYAAVHRTLTCDWCGEVIRDSYYNIHGEILCGACVEECKEDYTDD